MTFNTHPAILRTLVGTVGALLLASVCLGAAAGPGQLPAATPATLTLTA